VGGSLARFLLRDGAPSRAAVRRAVTPPPPQRTPAVTHVHDCAMRAGRGRSHAPSAPVADERVTVTGPERHALSGPAPPASRALPPVASLRDGRKRPPLTPEPLPAQRPVCTGQAEGPARRTSVQQQSAAARPNSTDSRATAMTRLPAQMTFIDSVADSSHQGTPCERTRYAAESGHSSKQGGACGAAGPASAPRSAPPRARAAHAEQQPRDSPPDQHGPTRRHRCCTLPSLSGPISSSRAACTALAAPASQAIG
jgi:hypothetical protein